MTNIYDLPQEMLKSEKFESLVSSKDILIERIISSGQITPEGQWYDQSTDEWVVLLQGQAEISYSDATKVHLKSGDYLLIPAHVKHRVDFTSTEPPCIWLAVHGQLIKPND